MGKTKQASDAGQAGPATPAAEGPTLRERIELILFLVVEVLCLLLFVDFLFFGIYVK